MSLAKASKRQAIYQRYGGRCVYCGKKKELTLDHLIPESRGGTAAHANLVPACSNCNGLKGDLSRIQFKCLIVASYWARYKGESVSNNWNGLIARYGKGPVWFLYERKKNESNNNAS